LMTCETSIQNSIIAALKMSVHAEYYASCRRG
jgi:hypothetical protein